MDKKIGHLQKQINGVYNAMTFLADIVGQTGTPNQLHCLSMWRDKFSDMMDKIDAEYEKSAKESKHE